MENMKNKISKWFLAIPGFVIIYIIQKIIDSYFPNVWPLVIKKVKSLWQIIITFLSNTTSVKNWIIILLTLLVIIQTYYVIRRIIVWAFSIRNIQFDKSKSVKAIIKNFEDGEKDAFFNIDSFLKKVDPLEQAEKNAIFVAFIEKDIKDLNIHKVLFHIINRSSFFHSIRLANELIKFILVESNSFILSSLLLNIESKTMAFINAKYKNIIWTDVVRVLRELEFHSTNDMVSTLNGMKNKIPRKYEKEVFIALLHISTSSAHSKMIAKEIFTNANDRILNKIFTNMRREEIIDEYFHYRRVIKEICLENKSIIVRSKLNRINQWLN